MASRRRPSPRQRRGGAPEKNADNSLAIKACIGAVVFLGLIIAFFSMTGSETPAKPGKDKSEARNRQNEKYDYGGGSRIEKPSKESRIPGVLTAKLLVAVANNDEAALDKIVGWDLLFRKLGSLYNWDKERRWENRDDEGKESMKDDYLFDLMNEDVQEVLTEYFVPAFEEDRIPPSIDIVGADNGRVGYMIKDKRDKKLLQFTVYSELLNGYDVVADVNNEKAWRVSRIELEQYGNRKAGGNIAKRSKRDMGAKLGKVKKNPWKKKGPAGPPEADISPVPWLKSTGEAERGRIQKLVDTMIADEDIRAFTKARNEVIGLGKPALPALLNAIASLDQENNDDMKKIKYFTESLGAITGKKFNYQPGRAKQGLGFGGMTKSTPEERKKALRRWFGWWATSGGPNWTKKEAAHDETWEDMEKDEEDSE